CALSCVFCADAALAALATHQSHTDVCFFVPSRLPPCLSAKSFGLDSGEQAENLFSSLNTTQNASGVARLSLTGH
ncbi:hypothetical protein, partial [Erwinia amylovora]|uniref:hypothetical protein n=1 Tax=Erwinia amylovora TaxID=552 RepID=UPI0020C0DADF